MNRFAQKLADHSLPLRHTRTEVLQINVGKLCNLTCVHCHVNAGPKRKEIMTRETIDRVIDWLAKTDIPTVDLTGGAPEMIPDFKYFVRRLKALTPPRHIIDRCNLTILLAVSYTHLTLPTTSAAKARPGDMISRVASVSGFPPGLGKYSPNTIAVASLPLAPRVILFFVS